MPPIRSESRQKLANQEGKILLALNDIEKGRVNSIRAAARLYEIPHTTLAGRAKGVKARVEKPLNGQYRIDQPDQFMAAHERKLQVFAALVDSFQSVHGFSGILPTATLIVPPATLQDALKQMGTLLRVGSLLIPGDLPAPPAASADSTVVSSAAVLPIDAPAEGSWSWIQPLKLEDSGSRQFSLTPASKLFAVPDGPQTVVEGYLKLDTVDVLDQ
ncbi:hypothetical protein PMG11_01233 [Penicillium brasilianum]|uniref:HTH psq-type domain-containing protein n=1 Tax=Penicillium brasilianum TaxID=104259 RepID=A0A0F7TGF2_PENBI|nr:hypothetical protein PMG11_01233 [Penicillium brasilianum]